MSPAGDGGAELSTVPLTGDELRPRRDQMMVEPIHETHLSVEAGIIEVERRVPAHVRARVVRFGDLTRDPGFGVGDTVLLTPHAGTIAPLDPDRPERMLIPVQCAYAVVEEP